MSTLKVNTIEEATSGGATVFTAKAFINFNGTGTVAIRDEEGVSSLTDITTGTYDINWSTSFANADYLASGVTDNVAIGGECWQIYRTSQVPTSSELRVYSARYAAAFDATYFHVIIHT